MTLGEWSNLRSWCSEVAVQSHEDSDTEVACELQ